MNGVFFYREPIKIIADILQTNLQLTASQVMTSNQLFEIPTDGLYLYVSYVGPAKVLASSNELVPDGFGGYNELQSVAMLHMIQIDIMSYDNEARTRKEEIAMALNSIFSEQSQELYQMHVARHPGPLLDTSFLEETKIMTRYTTNVITTSVNQKILAAAYIDAFSGEFITDNSDPSAPAILTPPVEPMAA